MAEHTIKNCLSIDIEGFIESNLQSFPIKEKYISREKENYEIEKNVHQIIEFLDNLSVKATFFYLGRIARDIPSIVKMTADCGHEIGCHFYDHLRVYGMDQNVFKENVNLAKKILEDVSGRVVYGFRAPDFSITIKSYWALDILKEAGFLYDSSIYPIGIHDVYGVPDAQYLIHSFPNGLIEFPLATYEILGRRIPFGGGGYFRLYPLLLTKYFIAQINKQGHPCMLYIHPYEVGTEIASISDMSLYRRFRHYYNCSDGRERLEKVMIQFDFCTAIEIVKQFKLIQ